MLHLRQIAVGGDLERFQSAALGLAPGAGGTPAGTPAPRVEKAKKVVPLAKQVTNKISSGSSKLTELMAWEAKVKDNQTLFPSFDLSLFFFLDLKGLCLNTTTTKDTINGIINLFLSPSKKHLEVCYPSFWVPK